jgi:diadenylate cyclase
MHPLDILRTVPRPGLIGLLDIAAVAFVIYRLMLVVKGTRAAHILVGILAVASIYWIALFLRLEALRSLLAMLAPYGVITAVILFQSEIRRALAKLGRKRFLGANQRPAAIDEILLALSTLSRDRVGALIVMERDIGLRTFVESGVRMDSEVSRDLLLTIFQPGTALHDGAVIIQKNRIAAAACFLPLSVNPAVSSKMGTRHRAGAGITEETDCITLIVSEETGAISIGAAGQLERNVTIERVDERLSRHFGGWMRGFGSTTPSKPVSTGASVGTELR